MPGLLNRPERLLMKLEVSGPKFHTTVAGNQTTRAFLGNRRPWTRRSQVNQGENIWNAAEPASTEPETEARQSGPSTQRPTAAPQTVRTQGARPSPRNDRARLAGAIIAGGIAGAAILGPLQALAASPAPSASGTAPAGSRSTSTDPDNDGAGRPGHGPGGHVEAVTDTSVVAKAIGISEADLTTALAAGQTVADVAKAHSVDVQVVIDALVADGQSELDAAVKAGTITQAQADAQKANLTQRATDQANGTLMGGSH
jgi:hypothetical protein